MAQSPSQRRAAQRRTAREIRSGMYQMGEAGRSYQQAISRQTVKVGKSDAYHHQQNFRSLDRAIEFANNLPPNQASYIVGKGDYNNSSKYKGKSNGLAALSSMADSTYYPYSASHIRSENEAIFSKSTSFYVRWRAKE
jgi:hypothetical protein